MNKQQQEEEEKYLFQQFLECYLEMPVGSEEYTDRPDVIYTTSEGKTIGIEITECIYDEPAKKKKEDQITFNYDVIAQLEDKLLFKFILDIELNSEIRLKKNRKDFVIRDIIKFCKEEFNNLKTFEPKQFENMDIDWNSLDDKSKLLILAANYRKLPPEILNICITRNDNIEKSTHSESAFGVIPNFSDIDLNKILTAKHRSLKNYKTCDEQWLLIIEGNDFYSDFKEINIQNSINTDFQKIFIYRRLNSEVVTVK